MKGNREIKIMGVLFSYFIIYIDPPCLDDQQLTDRSSEVMRSTLVRSYTVALSSHLLGFSKVECLLARALLIFFSLNSGQIGEVQ